MAISGQPPAPTSLSATADSSGNIDIAWTNGTTYDLIYVLHKQGGGSWSTLTTLGGSETSYEHESVTTNVLHYYYVWGYDSGYTEPSSDNSNTDSAMCSADTLTGTINVSGNIAEYVTGTDYTDTVTGTVYISGAVLDAQSLKTDYAYYVGDSNGKIYQYSAAYTGDAGANIPARWESKDTDFADQNIEWADKFKTIEKIRLHYIDKTSDATVSLLVSTDGGANWVSKTRSIGTGDGKGKTADFFLIKTGQIFRFAIVNASASDEFQFVGLEVFYSVGGDYFEIS
jgi:hypothetical protein